MIAIAVILCAALVGGLILLVAANGNSTPVAHAEIVEPCSRSIRPGETRWAYVAGRRRVYVRDSVFHEDREMLVITGTGDPRRQRASTPTIPAERVTPFADDPTARLAIAAYQQAADVPDVRPRLSVYA